jgi:D-sedoheptulose 7-phosphate isomerase
MKDVITNHIQSHIEVVRQLADETPDLESVAVVCIEALRRGNKILIAGNGGSVADAHHFAAELTGRFKRERKALPALALDANPSAVTAIGNDYSFAKVYARQIEALAKPGDVFFGISTSGTSENILEAIQAARNAGCRVIGLTGKSGGKMAESCDFLINIPSDDTPRIQEMHTLVIHALSDLVEDALQSDSEENIVAKLAKIKLFALDFDGVLTDNRVLVSSDGTEQVVCSREDSLGIDLLQKSGVEVMVISKEKNQVVELRCQKLGIPCRSGIDNKYEALAEEAQKRNLQREQVCFVGNDAPDDECIKAAGVGVAVADSTESTQEAADYTTKKNGGKGAVREVAELILQAQHG